MIIPVRCFTCGKVIGSLYEAFKMRVKEGQNPCTVLDDLGVERYCCRAIMLGHVELIDTVARFKKV